MQDFLYFFYQQVLCVKLAQVIECLLREFLVKGAAWIQSRIKIFAPPLTLLPRAHGLYAQQLDFLLVSLLAVLQKPKQTVS